MCINNLFEKIKLKIRVKLDFNSFFIRENKKRNSTKYMETPTSEVEEIYNKIRDNVKYQYSIDLYNDYNQFLSIHNEIINRLHEKVDNFHYEEILKNPLDVDVDNVLVEYNDAYEILSNYTLTDEKFSDFINNYNVLKYDFENLINQYKVYIDANAALNEFDDKYIDGKELEERELIIVKSKEYFSKCKIKYYFIQDCNIVDVINEHNQSFIEKNINNVIFDDVNGKSLDIEQRKAILYNPKSNLTIAGAGSGKTLTICGKVKYLLECLNVGKNDILLLSYSNKSAKDLSKKINDITPDMNVYTFHALGLEMLSNYNGKKNNVDDSFNAIIEKYFREHLKTDRTMLYKVFKYYSLYLDDYKEEVKYNSKGELYESLKKSEFVTLKNQLQKFNKQDKLETIKKELVKSNEELIIANFLFINGINYEYESSYKSANTATNLKRQYKPDFYLPDYDLYYEHYGINENGLASQYTEPEASDYVRTIEWKRELHKNNNTKCIETYSYEFKNSSIFNKLEERLLEHGVEFNPLSDEEVYNAIDSIYYGQSFKSFINLIRTFISLYKAKYPNDEFFNILKNNTPNSYQYHRSKLFLEICKDVYNYYINHLVVEEKIDFDDMIMKTIEIIPNLNGYKYKYIIVDEFQDISFSRMKFLKALIEHGDSKLFAVGDDWQAIYRFSGCDINIFLNFDKYFEDPKTCFITSTRRYSQKLQDVAEHFITRNPEQYQKNVKSNKNLDDPIKIMYYDDNKYNYFIKVLSDIAQMNVNANVLLLGRNRKDIEILESERFYRDKRNSDKFISLDFPSLNIKYITTHASKGLEEDYVVIINADDEKLGFPNKIEDDSLLDLVLSSPSNYLYAEERRLWYVALTRTRSYVYILVNFNKPSTFVMEIMKGAFIMNPRSFSEINSIIKCPNCKSGHLILRESHKDFSKFYSCSNYPYCNYKNNDIKQVNTNHRCKCCGDFMVYRKGQFGAFWGCRNYPICTYTEKYIHKSYK